MSKLLMHTVNTSALQCGVMTRVGLTGGKDIGSSTDRTVRFSPRSLMVFTLTLTDAVRSILLRCFLD